MRKKIAFITGITGQDGSLLAEFLLKKNYIVHGLKRRTSTLYSTHRLDKIYQDKNFKKNKTLILHYGDVTDGLSCAQIIREIMPDEIYHLAAQSHVAISQVTPYYTTMVDSIGTLNILEVVKSIKSKKIKFYNAATSEMYGTLRGKYLDEKSEFRPQSPYASSKLLSFWFTKNYRDSYKIFACNGILFNHEGITRGENFVTRKITRFVAKYHNEKKGTLYLGNLSAKRNWGYAPEYVVAMWKMLQQKKPDDFVIATNEAHTVREFLKEAFKQININIVFKGSGVNEVGLNSKTKKIIVKSISYYYRPNDVEALIGKYSKAKKILKWSPKLKFKSIVKIMVDADLENYTLYNYIKTKVLYKH